jgi:hypothetical protein
MPLLEGVVQRTDVQAAIRQQAALLEGQLTRLA